MTTSLIQLDNLLQNHQQEIEDWFKLMYAKQMPCLYSSVDLRYSGHKLAPVDTNLFPAGFNNLSNHGATKAISEIQNFIANYFPKTANILLLPEEHTRNLYYLENLVKLKSLFEQSGFKVMIGTLSDIEDVLILNSASGSTLEIHKLIKENNLVQTLSGFIPDLVVLNNDLTSGIPELISNINQPVVPAIKLGWYQRRKSKHFSSYNTILRKFSESFPIDTFLLSAMFTHCGKVNFKEQQGLECIALNAEKLLHLLREKYREYNIDDKPYVFIKADNGTYGRGIMKVSSGEEVYKLNKKLRNDMNIIKGGIFNTEVIIQEGIKTIEKIDNNVAEPVVYLMNGNPINCMYRVNTEHDEYSNLNSPGMYFTGNLCDDKFKESYKTSRELGSCDSFAFIARLASLAAAYEE